MNFMSVLSLVPLRVIELLSGHVTVDIEDLWKPRYFGQGAMATR